MQSDATWHTTTPPEGVGDGVVVVDGVGVLITGTGAKPVGEALFPGDVVAVVGVGAGKVAIGSHVGPK